MATSLIDAITAINTKTKESTGKIILGRLKFLANQTAANDEKFMAIIIPTIIAIKLSMEYIIPLV